MEQTRTRTVDEFIAWEEGRDGKYEFSAGEISASPGGANRHHSLTLALGSKLFNALQGRYKVFVADAKVVGHAFARYPDVVVTRDPRDGFDERAVSYPTLLVEVLSPSTHVVDRQEKFDEYRTLESLEEYVMVDSSKRRLQSVLRRNGQWIVSLPIESGTFEFASVAVSIDLDALFTSVEL